MSRNYYQIEKAVSYMVTHLQPSPSTEELADEVSLDTDDLQQMFTEWSGVDPVTFSGYLARQLINKNDRTLPDLFDAAGEKADSRAAQLHDRFFRIKRMMPGLYKKGGQKLEISYSVHYTPFGKMMAASTPQGICRVSFLTEDEQAGKILKDEFPQAELRQTAEPEQIRLAGYFQKNGSTMSGIDLHLKGTPFQISVWEALLRIPEGKLAHCSDIAKEIENPKALRAVGSAVGKNPIAYFIPCHRIIKADGGLGNYRWGRVRKAAMIGWEAARSSETSTPKKFRKA